MKSLFLILPLVLFINLCTNAQYRINKTKYDYHTYSHQVGDPYNPSMSGIASFLIPGLGQMASGEIGRGAVFLGGLVGSIAIWAIGDNIWTQQGANEDDAPFLVYLGFTGIFVADIWSVIDAVHVAKVNNLAFRDKNKTTYLQVNPYLGSLNNQKVPVGISIKIWF